MYGRNRFVGVLECVSKYLRVSKGGGFLPQVSLVKHMYYLEAPRVPEIDEQTRSPVIPAYDVDGPRLDSAVATT